MYWPWRLGTWDLCTPELHLITCNMLCVFRTGALDQLKLRLRKRNISIVAVQETKWKEIG